MKFKYKRFFSRLRQQPETTQIFKASGLRRRILLINLAVLVVPIVSIMWATTYRQSLINNEIHALKIEAEVFAAALAEGSVTPSATNWTSFDLPASQYLLRRMVRSSNVRARLWNHDGKALLDSRVIGRAAIIETNKLAALSYLGRNKEKFKKWYNHQIRRIAWSFSNISALPVAINSVPPYVIDDYSEVQSSLSGENSAIVRRSLNDDYTLQLSVSAPVQRYKRVYGAVQLMRGSEQIDAALISLYNRLIIIFLITFAITAILSFWLAFTIASPIHKLTYAANYIRHSKNRKGEIPDLSRRKDEIGQLSTDLRAMTQTLWDRMDAIEAFAADVSHELKNPLTSLKSAVETLQLAKKPEQIERLKKIIDQDVDRLNRLITDISDASRLDAELSRSTAAIVDFKKLVSDIHNLYTTTGVVHKNIHFTLKDDTKLKELFVAADSDRLTQIIRNLIGNAISFAPDNSEILLKLKQAKNIIYLDIIDDGVGIPEAAFEKIFQRFYTERPKSESFGNHSGLGLAISRQIAETYHGSLTAHKREDDKSGALFRLTLPLAGKK
ncbi:MAG: stimulus-sensing domain-containing protein [Alphaproteobacteria bacterium]